MMHISSDIFDRMVREQGLEKTLLPLMDDYPDLSAQAELADQIAGAETLRRQGAEIHTVGVFYYCANNGGAERVLCQLIGIWTNRGFRVVLMTDRPATAEDYPIPDGVHRYVLPETAALTPESRKERFRMMQRILREEKVDAFVHHAWLSKNLLWDLLAVKTLGIPFIQYTHGVFSCMVSEGDPEAMDILRCMTSIYRLTDEVIALSHTYQAFWQNFHPHVRMLCNPCLAPSPRTLARKPAHMIWVGRISPEKRALEAVKILHEVRKQCPEATLTVVGSALPAFQYLEEELCQTIAELGEQEHVKLAGFQADPGPYYQEASLILITSAYEGFALAVAEAKSYGVPTVMYDLPSLYFTEEGKGLVRVPQLNAEAAGEAIAELFRNPERLETLSAEALESSKTFSDETLGDQWQEIFSSVETADESALPPLSSQALAWKTMLEHLRTGTKVWEKREADYRFLLAQSNIPFAARVKRKAARMLRGILGRKG